jgi:hypothetical protein
MKKMLLFVVLILTVSWTAFGQQPVLNNPPCKPKTFSCDQQQDILLKLASGDYYAAQVKRLKDDSTNLAKLAETTAARANELQGQVNLANHAIAKQGDAIDKATVDLAAEKVKVTEAEDARDRQKRLKWVFGAVGAGLMLALHFIL